MSGLWRKHGIAGGKFLVRRRDGSIPEWPNFVLGARDPAAPSALLAYAEAAERLNFDPEFVSDIRALAGEFSAYRTEHGNGDPDAPPHRKDDLETVAAMTGGNTQ